MHRRCLHTFWRLIVWMNNKRSNSQIRTVTEKWKKYHFIYNWYNSEIFKTFFFTSGCEVSVTFVWLSPCLSSGLQSLGLVPRREMSRCGCQWTGSSLSLCPVIALWLLQDYVTYYLSANIFFLCLL